MNALSLLQVPDVAILKDILSLGVPGILAFALWAQWRERVELVKQMREDSAMIRAAFIKQAEANIQIAAVIDGLKDALQEVRNIMNSRHKI